jgi:hypothetical protein
MGVDDQHRVERLRAALRDLAAQDAGELLAEARTQARARVRQILSEALIDSTLDEVRRLLMQPPPAPAPPSEPSELGWYVYGVVGAETAPAWTATGTDRQRSVSTVREGSVAAVVSRVPLDEFGEARLREHLADMGWVEETARAHEEVLEQTRSQVTVIPMRMCTVYRTEASLREMLRREAAGLSEALAHLHGKTEMGVKVFADRDRAESALTADAGAGERGGGEGAAYMERRRRERDRAEALDRRLEQAAEEIHERLCALSTEGRLSPPQRPEASGHPGEMILNGVYLVADDDLEPLRREISTLQEAFGSSGLELELTGPWPAYNFVPDTIGATW